MWCSGAGGAGGVWCRALVGPQKNFVLGSRLFPSSLLFG